VPNPTRTWRLATVGVLGALALLPLAACGGSDGPATTTERAEAVSTWDGASGWRPRPAAPEAAPRASWRVPARLDDDGSYLVNDGVVVVADRPPGASMVTVTRIDPNGGGELWSATVEASGPIQLAEDPAGSVVTVVTETGPDGAEATVLDAETGAVVWTGVGDAAISVQSLDDVLLVADFPTSSAVDRESGEVLWTTDRFLTVSDGQVLAEDLDVSGKVETSNVAVLDPATGEARWDLKRPLFGDVVIVGDTLVLTQDDGGIGRATGYEVADGTERWQAKVPPVGRTRVEPIGDDAILVISGDVSGSVAGDRGTAVVALALADGSERWRTMASTTTTLLVDDEARVVLDRDDGTELIKGLTGDVLGRSDTLPYAPPGIAGGAVYVAEDGKVAARAVPGLDVLWDVTVDDEELLGATDGGFVTVAGDGRGSELVGYTG